MEKLVHPYTYKSVIAEATEEYPSFSELYAIERFVIVQDVVARYSRDEKKKEAAKIKVSIGLQLIAIHTLRKN